MTIDLFGHEYGYTPQQVRDIPIIGTLILIQRIENCYKSITGKGKQGKRGGDMSINQLRNVMRLG